MTCNWQQLKEVEDSPNLTAFLTTDTSNSASTNASRGKLTGSSNAVRKDATMNEKEPSQR